MAAERFHGNHHRLQLYVSFCGCGLGGYGLLANFRRFTLTSYLGGNPIEDVNGIYTHENDIVTELYLAYHIPINDWYLVPHLGLSEASSLTFRLNNKETAFESGLSYEKNQWAFMCSYAYYKNSIYEHSSLSTTELRLSAKWFHGRIKQE